MTPTVLVTLAVVHSAPVWIDMHRLAGEWRGQGHSGRCTVVITPNGACLERSAGRLRAATYRIDPSKRPAEIDFWDRGAEAPRRGIYKVSGDTLTMSWAETRGGPRPSRFGAACAETEVLHLARVARAAPPAGDKELTRLTPWANKLFTGSPDAPPPVLVQDAGVVPKGQTRTVRLKVTNIYAVRMEVREPVSSRRACAVVRWPDRLDPNQSGFIEVVIDTRGLDGENAVRVPVLFRGVDRKTGLPAEDLKTGMQFKSTADVVIRFVSR